MERGINQTEVALMKIATDLSLAANSTTICNATSVAETYQILKAAILENHGSDESHKTIFDACYSSDGFRDAVERAITDVIQSRELSFSKEFREGFLL